MATQTTNYGLTKPSYNETADIGVINSNMDIIDAKMKAIENKAGSGGGSGNTDTYGHVKVGSVTIDASGDDTIELVAGSNVTLTPDITSKSVTISATDGGTSVTVDSELSTTSENPVQNKVITEQVSELKSDLVDISIQNNLVCKSDLMVCESNNFTNVSLKTTVYILDYFIPSDSTVFTLDAYANEDSDAKIYVISKTNIVLDIIDFNVTNGWNYINIKNTYNEDIKIGINNARWAFRVTLESEKAITPISPRGLVEGNTVNIGDTITFSRATTDLYYFAIKLSYYRYTEETVTLNDKIDSIKTEFEIKEIDEPFGYVGRWYNATINNVNCKCTNNCGSEIYFTVEGVNSFDINWITDVNVAYKLWYGLSIDGSEIERRDITNNTVNLPDTNKHKIRLVTDGVTQWIRKWNDGQGFGFNGCSVETKGFIPKKPIIHFYGDSITEGIRVFGVESGSDDGLVNASTKAFPWFCCEKIGAVSYRIGYGATGVTTTGSFHPFKDSVRYFYNGVNVEKQYPNLVVVNYGTNDTEVDSKTFISGYNEALDFIKDMYPYTKIVCMIPFIQRHASDIRNIVAQRKDCYLIDTSGWSDNMDFADGVHPLANGAKYAGEKLANILVNANLI